MSHMEKQVEQMEFIEVESNEGTEYFPADLLSGAKLETVRAAAGDAGERTIAIVRPYVQASRVIEVRTRFGWGARLSAPGYMDCTPWAVYGTQEEAEASLDEDEEEEEHSPAPLGWDKVDTSTEADPDVYVSEHDSNGNA